MEIKSVAVVATLLSAAGSNCMSQPLFAAPSPVFQGQTTNTLAPSPGLSSAGPGPVRKDFTGKLYRYVDSAGNVVTGPVEVDGYGEGVHRDQYGRAVRPVPLDGETGTALQPR